MNIIVAIVFAIASLGLFGCAEDASQTFFSNPPRMEASTDMRVSGSTGDAGMDVDDADAYCEQFAWAWNH